MNVAVKVKPNEQFERALKRFVRDCKRAGLIRELTSRGSYTKPSVRKREKQRKARKRIENEKRRALRVATRRHPRRREGVQSPFRPSRNGVLTMRNVVKTY